MLKAILLAAGLVLLIPGAESLRQQLVSRTPTLVTCAEYARARPSATWLRVRECEVDYLGAGYRESGGSIEELFFPVRSIGAPRTEPAALVASTRDPAVLAIAESGIGKGRQVNQEQFRVMMLKIVTALGASRELAGMARNGALSRLRTRRVLSGLTTPLADGVVILDLNARPGAAVPAVQTAAGLGLIVGALVLFRGARQSGQGGAKVAVSPQSAVARVRGLLLLNLGPDEGLEQIEHAAPLGGREETIRRISDVIEGITFDAGGRGHRRGADYSVIVDIGLEDPVSSAVAGADGATGAELIRRLLVDTGWRAYVPVAGRFMEPSDLPAVTRLESTPGD